MITEREEREMDWGDWDGIGGGDEKGGDNARERHRLAERERRKSMRELFLSLHSHLPHAHTVRKEQSAILDEIIKYIPLDTARLRNLQARRDGLAAKPSQLSPSLPIYISDHSPAASALDFDIRVMPDEESSVSIRVRGNRVNVSLTDAKGSSRPILLSAILDQLEDHHLELVRSTHCRDGSRLIHHSESKIIEGLEISPAQLKSSLQGLAWKLHKLRKSSALKRRFDQLD